MLINTANAQTRKKVIRRAKTRKMCVEACWECSQRSPLRPTYHTTGARAHNAHTTGARDPLNQDTGSTGSRQHQRSINAASTLPTHRHAKSDKTCKKCAKCAQRVVWNTASSPAVCSDVELWELPARSARFFLHLSLSPCSDVGL